MPSLPCLKHLGDYITLKIKSKFLTLVLKDLAQPPSPTLPLTSLSLQPAFQPLTLLSVSQARPSGAPLLPNTAFAWNALALTFGRMPLMSQPKCHLLREVLRDYLILRYNLLLVYI